MASLTDLIRSGRLERISADVTAAKEKVKEARQHLTSAPKIWDDDPEGAYALIYDAARKAVDAHLQANGLRVTNRPGAHAATAEYAEAEWRGTAYETSAERLDGIRRNRNRTEYGQWHISASVMKSDLEHAREIVKAVESALK